MSFIAIGDLHLKNKYLENNKKCLFSCLDTINKIKNKYNIELFDFIVILGDVYDTHNMVECTCLKLFDYFLNKVCEYTNQVFIIIGNHDVKNPKELFSDTHAFNSYKKSSINVKIVDKIYSWNKFLFIPYVDINEDLFSLLDEYNKNWMNEYISVFSHIEIKDFYLAKNYKSKNGFVWKDTYPQLISGHLHHYQKENNVLYIGSVYKSEFIQQKSINNYICLGTYDDEKLISIEKKKLDIKNNIIMNTNLQNIKHDYKQLDLNNNIRIIFYYKNNELEIFKNSDLYLIIKNNENIQFLHVKDKPYMVDNKNNVNLCYKDIFYENININKNKNDILNTMKKYNILI